MPELIPKGRTVDVKGDGGKRTEKRSIPTAQKQVYVRLRAQYEMKLETDGRDHTGQTGYSKTSALYLKSNVKPWQYFIKRLVT